MFDHETWHGFESSKGVYNDQQFAEFDYILYSAAQHNIRVIPVFENYWEAYGGIDTRLSWEGLATGQANRWRFFNQSACPGCFTQYKNYVNYALNRTNHYTGVKYKDDPTVFAWELMNEPRYEGQGTDENANGTTLRKWVDEMGAYIKGIDGNHMLDAGLEGHGTQVRLRRRRGQPVRQHSTVAVHRLHLGAPVPERGLGQPLPRADAHPHQRLAVRLARRGRQAVLHGRVQHPGRGPQHLVDIHLQRPADTGRGRQRVLVVPGRAGGRRQLQRQARRS